MSNRKARSPLTPEDVAIFRGNVRAINMAEGDTLDGSLMARLQQWRGSSMQQGFPIAKQLANWDFSARVMRDLYK